MEWKRNCWKWYIWIWNKRWKRFSKRAKKKLINLSDKKLIYSFFEGEYLNWERNGIIKEVIKGSFNDITSIIFECEYSNGKKNGKGKEYFKYY